MSYIGNEPIVSATRTITEIVATAGQTVFVANGGYTVGFIDVFVNGAQLQTNDFTATNGTSVTLGTGATIGDDIRLVAYGTFSTSNTYTTATADAVFQRRDSTLVNKLINGCMRIDQRNAGASVTNTTSTVYTLDRWSIYGAQASKFTCQQNAGSATPPNGFINYTGITSSSAYSVGTSETFLLRQFVEGFNVADLGWGTASAQTVTLSFWVRSSLTGTFGGSLQNSNQDRAYPFSYTISSVNTWEQKSVTIAGDTTGSWLTNNGTGIRLAFSLGTGATASGTANTWATGAAFAPTGATSVVGTSGATFYITGVDLRKGSYSTAPTFDMRQYGQELALCQRYYFGGTFGYFTGTCLVSNINKITGFSKYPATMRTSPTITFGVTDIDNVGGFGSPSITDISIDALTTVTVNNGVAGRIGRAAYTASAEL